MRSHDKRDLIVLAAGGTGGHLFPAQALAEELGGRGFEVHLFSDARVRDHGAEFPATQIYEIPSATVTLSRPHRLPLQTWRLVRGYGMSRAILRRLRPRVVVGFGGYPSYPPMLAAWRLGIPTVIHEQNAVMGRANRAIARSAAAIASSFPVIVNLPPRLRAKVVLTGNPVRAAVQKVAGAPYEKPMLDKPFRILVFGGSQGARYFSELLPAAMADLPGAVRRKLRVTQQCRPEDIEAVQSKYAELKLEHEVAPFFADMAARLVAAHLVICRAGASTIAELGVVGRPAVLVPLPHSIESDQLHNARSFARAGAGWLVPEAEMTPEFLASLITRFRFQENELVDAAAAARHEGRVDAAKRLADLVQSRITVPDAIPEAEKEQPA
ncbi:MAG TPA: undecaprenyldiphospho-muramoylpentapeptide beta-N-acetylglucosaminyltransferase [Aestuariivirgaceae bacterium]|nr:undecaprenyldiphospho-muramoylpentapeptide beta-N-acetylglucosaminyltransferase [Aestuariivirgaceae bacterium]